MKPTETIEQLALRVAQGMNWQTGSTGCVEFLRRCLSEQEKREPVAWMRNESSIIVFNNAKKSAPATYEQFNIPLYAGPAIPQPAAVPDGWDNHVRRMWAVVRKNDSTIPDDVLDRMRDFLLSAAPVPPSQEAKDAERYCNKCGYFGEEVFHNKPGTNEECDYVAMSASKEASDGNA